MTIDAAFKKIDRYLKKENIGPLVVDAQNRNDLDAIVSVLGTTDLCENRKCAQPGDGHFQLQV